MLVNPLARVMFERGVASGTGSTITVTAAHRTPTGVELEIA